MHAVIKGGKTARASALVQQGLQLILQGRYEDALAAEEAALGLAPTLPDAHSYRGSALLQLGRVQEALVSYDQVIRLSPNAAVAHYNRANALQRLRRYEEALPSLKRALRLQPRYTDALSLTGIVLQAMGDTASALEHYDAALRINPNAADAHYNKGLALLTAGEFNHAWEHYEWRLRWDVTVRVGQSRSVDRVAPDWDGKPTDKPILVIPEQGLGDQILYAGMLADLQAIAPGSTVCLEPRLLPLFERSFDNLSFSSPYDIDAQQCIRDGTFSAQSHIGSLGKYFRVNAAGLKRVKTPYLKADPIKISRLRSRIAKPGRIVCGISWRSKNAEIGTDKSLSLELLVPLLAAEGVDFVDLQYGDTAEDRHRLKRDHSIHVQHLDDVDNTNDLDSLAALISACDIVITISNVTAHIAGALGKPTIVMLSDSPSPLWYWPKNRIDTPWYPSTVLVRQNQLGNWLEVVSSVETTLAEFKDFCTA
ncbi:GT9_LPS_heptosyltransferase domain containing protein [Oxalobacteraceae bacterium]|jgi:Flp pilus assembly protein TadD